MKIYVVPKLSPVLADTRIFAGVHNRSTTASNSMATKRKKVKRRSKASGIFFAILSGLMVVAGLCVTGGVGYFVYTKVILPNTAASKAERLQERLDAAGGPPNAVPAGWKIYSHGNLQVLAPETNMVPDGQTLASLGGVTMTVVYKGEADGFSIGITSLNYSANDAHGRSFYEQAREAGQADKLQGKIQGKIIYQRQLEGTPRCHEMLIEKPAGTELSRWFEDGPHGILIVAVLGDANSERFIEVGRSMTYRTP